MEKVLFGKNVLKIPKMIVLKRNICEMYNEKIFFYSCTGTR